MAREEYPEAVYLLDQFAHEVCLILLRHAEAATETNDWQQACDLAWNALEVEPGNSEATLLHDDTRARLHLKNLAKRALQAYKDQNLTSCRTACKALLSYQKECGAEVEFADSSEDIVNFALLPEKLSQEIMAREEAERRWRAEMARAEKIAVVLRILKISASCALIALLVLGVMYWRRVQFEKRIQTFDSAMRAQSYDSARTLAAKIADKHPPAADLLAYFVARAEFDAAWQKSDYPFLLKHAGAKLADVKTQKQRAEASAGNPSQGIEAYRQASALLVECTALAQAKAREEREEAERKRAQEAKETEQLRARVQEDLIFLADNLSPKVPLEGLMRTFDKSHRDAWTAAAGRGWGEGQILLSLAYQFGIYAGRDPDKGLLLQQQAAAQGVGVAEYCVAADMLSAGRTEAEAAPWVQRAAEHGVAHAQAVLGLWYLAGANGLPKNSYEAVAWFKRAAEKGNVLAQYHLGLCYFHGDGIAKREDEAVRWIRLAAQNGDVDAQYCLALMHRDGAGVAQDASQEAAWYKKAAAQGHAVAQNNLGAAYQNGGGVYQDINEAVRWYRLAARQGNETAIGNLQNLGVKSSGYLFRCPRCGRTKTYARLPRESAGTSSWSSETGWVQGSGSRELYSCPDCGLLSDMEFVGPAY